MTLTTIPNTMLTEVAVDSVAALRLLEPKDATFVLVLGYNSPGDGGGGPVRYFKSGEAPGTYVDNGADIIVPSGGDGSAAWLWSSNEPQSFMAYGGLSEAIAANPTDPVTIVVDSAPLALTANITAGDNITWEWKAGCVVALGAYNLTINGPIIAWDYQLFDDTGAGSVAVGLGLVKPEWWGVDGVDDTAAFYSAINSLSGGGTILLAARPYRLKDYSVRKKNVFFRGVGSNTGYESGNNGVTRLEAATGANWIMDLGHTDTNLNAKYCAVQDVYFDGRGVALYTLIVNTAATIVDRIFSTGGKYGVLAMGLNSNIFSNSAFVGHIDAGFAVVSPVDTYIFPTYTPGNVVSSTIYTIEKCRFRENRMGAIFREGSGARLTDNIFESNVQDGTYFYRPTGRILSKFTLDNNHFENNYPDYVTGSTDYDITGIDALKLSASTYVDWVDAFAGYQIMADAQVRSTGYIERFIFNQPEFQPAGSDAKGMRLMSTLNWEFNNANLVGGDQTNYTELDPDYAFFTKFFNCNGGLATVLGSKTGNRTIIERNNPSNTDNSDRGGTELLLGHFQASGFKLTGSDETDTNTLGDFEWATWTPAINIETGGSFTTNTASGVYTKIGKVVLFHCKVDWDKAAGSNNFWVSGLPYAASTTHLSRVLFVQSDYSGYGTYVVNGRVQGTLIRFQDNSSGKFDNANSNTISNTTGIQTEVTGLYFVD